MERNKNEQIILWKSDMKYMKAMLSESKLVDNKEKARLEGHFYLYQEDIRREIVCIRFTFKIY